MLPRQAADVQRNEIDASRRTLEALVAKPIKSFAYPFGAFSDETVRLVERGKFEFAVTCEDRLVEGGVDPFRLPRLEVTARGQVKFDEWLAGRFSAPSGSR
jgi:peptidoglycan/xylan/chitin deacetylase (PgdA/CDA1 family)